MCPKWNDRLPQGIWHLPRSLDVLCYSDGAIRHEPERDAEKNGVELRFGVDVFGMPATFSESASSSISSG